MVKTKESALGSLLTELRNPATEHLDELPTLEMLTLINAEDAKVAVAVQAELPQIAKAVDAIAGRFDRGGRLFYIGAGTSGRLGVLDASECPPTFNVDAGLVQGLIAGGDRALRLSSEHSEDLRDLVPTANPTPWLASQPAGAHPTFWEPWNMRRLWVH
jgi:N-acetylmuramic acid 6-phosphate etherase